MYCTCGRISENTRYGGLCATCNHAARKAERQAAKPKKVYKLPKSIKPIAKVSGKMAKALGSYARDKAGWIKNKNCAVYLHLPASDVHHMKGRVGYADDWARQNDVPLLLDKRFWLPVSRVGHVKITLESTWALENGYSLSRLENINA